MQQLQNNSLVQLKLISYMEAEIEALKAENAALREAPEKNGNAPRSNVKAKEKV